MEKYRIIKKGIERKYHEGKELKGCAVEIYGELMYVAATIDTRNGACAMLVWEGIGGELLSIVGCVTEGVSVYPAAIVDGQGREQTKIQITKYL